MAAGSYNVVNPGGGSGSINTGQGGSLSPWYIEPTTNNWVNPTLGPLNNNGIRLGPNSSSGVTLSLNAANTLRIVSADGTLNSTYLGLFRTALVDGTVQYTDTISQGLAGISFSSDGSNIPANISARLVRQRYVTQSKTANYTVLIADTGVVFDNAGATGTVNFTLPPATVGQNFTFCTVVAQIVSVTPNSASDTIVLGSKAAGAAITSTAAKGGYLQLTCTSANTWAIAAVSASPSWS